MPKNMYRKLHYKFKPCTLIYLIMPIDVDDLSIAPKDKVKLRFLKLVYEDNGISISQLRKKMGAKTYDNNSSFFLKIGAIEIDKTTEIPFFVVGD